MATPNIYEVCAQYYDDNRKKFIRDSLGFYTSRKKAEIDCNMLFMITRDNPDISKDWAFIVVTHEPNKLTTYGQLMAKDWEGFFEDMDRTGRYIRELVEQTNVKK